MLAHDTGPRIPFDKLKEARVFKAELKRLTGSDAVYYSVLERFGIKHADEVPEGKDPEQHAKFLLDSLKMEVNVCRWELPGLACVIPQKIFLAFKGHAEIEELRHAIKFLSGGDESFYTKTLASHGYKDASEIVAQPVGLKIHKALGLERNRLREEVGLLGVLESASEKLGARLFADVLRRHDCATIPEVMALGSDPLAALLTELRLFIKDSGKE